MAEIQDPPKPPQGELTQRDDDMQYLAGPYARLLMPDDSVLTFKGGDYSLYRETLRDDACMAPFEQRRLAVTKCEWTVDAGASDAQSKAAADWLKEQLQSLEWDRITDGMLYARWYGHAVAECLFAPDLTEGKVTLTDIRVRDRGRFAYGNDAGPPYIWDKRAGRWVRLPERKMWTISTGADNDDAPYGLGLAHYAYWPVFFKRNNIKFWLVFLEKFGMPTAVAKMPAGKFAIQAERDKVREAMRAMASETGIILPEGTEFEFINAVRSGTQDYDTMRAAMDAALAKIIIGQTASTQGTPGRLGNDELQTEVKNDLVKADADLVCGSFNRSVAKWLTEWNFPGAVTPRVWRVVDPPEDVDTIAERDSKLYNMGWERTDDSFKETYGEGWQRKAAQDTGKTPQELMQQAAAEFAELGTIATLRAGHRADQDSLLAAAEAFAGKYDTVVGKRIERLLAYAEESNDFETFRARILEMMAEPAPVEFAEPVARAGLFARLMGKLRGQR